MLLSTNAFIKWNSRNKKHYTKCGYKFTKTGDELNVLIKDLTKGSQAFVRIRCDYCGKEYDLCWCVYNSIHKKSAIGKDACAECCKLKSREAVINK